LQNSLQAKAKSEPSYRFYSLWDKVYREDVLREAYRRSRANAGAPGVDGIDFEGIETAGVDRWLKTLQEELRSQSYVPQPLLRVWIPKRNGGRRPLSIPTVKDRVVQTAVVLVLGPIFEADLAPQQYGFRPGRDARQPYGECTFTSLITTGGRWWMRTYPTTSPRFRMALYYGAFHRA
jgi:RNA-directed DNA polymerase